MNWFDTTSEFHERTFSHDGRLTSLPQDWQRELAALWRLEADVNNGAYLQFLCNWGRESYVYASRGLKRMGAVRMARLIDTCQSLVDEHWGDRPLKYDKIHEMLPEDVLQAIYDLSGEFMDYPEDIEALGVGCYRDHADS